MEPVPLEVRISVTATWEIKSRPTVYLVWLADRLVAIVRINELCHASLHTVGSGLVVHHGVKIYRYGVCVQGIYSLLEFLACAVFGTHGSLLVELSKVVKVVHTISHITASASLVCRRNPHCRHSDVVQMFSVFFQLFPKFTVVRQIPFEILHHNSILHTFFHFYCYTIFIPYSQLHKGEKHGIHRLFPMANV